MCYIQAFALLLKMKHAMKHYILISPLIGKGMELIFTTHIQKICVLVLH